MATKEEQDVLRLLVQHVARGFYEPKYTIVLDMLARHTVLKDDDFAGRMGMQAKELNKLVAVLLNDRLIKTYRQNELKEGAQRSVGRQYYYVDYEDFTNVVKWRVARMRHLIDNNLRNELDNKGYICPQCNTAYSPLDVDKLMDFSLNAFICEICQAELIDNENADNVRGSKDRMQRFNHQMRFIRQGLQKIDSMVLPAFDITAWVKNTAKDLDSAQDSGPGLKIAGSGPSTQDSGVGIMLSMDKDEATKKLERDAEAEAKRQQNALPAWHLKSTISGDLTALGVRENARAEQVASTSSNDDILRGLGVVGGNKRAPLLAMEPVEDVKPVINHEADLYEQYYASLAASTAASTANTPSGLGASSSDDFGGEDEEDKKPSIEYLNSLNDYRKRSRSAEDIGGGKGKVAKIEENCYNLSLTNGHHLDGVVGKPPDQVPSSNDNDPMIMVDGKKMRFSEVTEEHHDLMTPDEYTAYFDVLQAQSM